MNFAVEGSFLTGSYRRCTMIAPLAEVDSEGVEHPVRIEDCLLTFRPDGDPTRLGSRGARSPERQQGEAMHSWWSLRTNVGELVVRSNQALAFSEP